MRYRSVGAAAVLSLFFAGSVLAADLKFSMQPNPASDKVTHYRIHYGIKTRTYTKVVDLGLPPVVDGRIVGTVTGLVEGTEYFFAATANNATGQSAYSNEVVTTIPVPLPAPFPPSDFKQELTINVSATSVKINILNDVATK